MVVALVEECGMDIEASVSKADGSTVLHWGVIRDNELLTAYTLVQCF
jgi:hypothetical protein